MVKGRLCKSLIRRFESDRRLHLPAAALAFVAAGLVYYGTAFLPGRVLLPLDILNDYAPWKTDGARYVPASNRLVYDAIFQFDVWDVVARRALSEGRFPWTNPWSGDGAPLFANQQSALLSPFTWPRLLLGRPGWAFCALLKFLAACFGARLLAIRMGASPRAAVLSGLAYAGCAYSILWTLHPHTNVSAMLPWIAAFGLGVLAGGGRRDVAGLVAAAALATAGGHPETLFQGVLGVSIFLVWEFVSRLRRDPEALGRGLRAGGAAFAGFLLLGVTIVPLVPLIRDSGYRTARLSRAAPAFRWPAALAQVFPGFVGGPLKDEIDPSYVKASLENFIERTGGYAGLLVLAAVLLGVRRLSPPFRRGLAVGAVFLAAAWAIPPTGWLLKRLPVFGMSENGRLALVFALFVAVAAGPAIEALAAAPRRRVAGGLLVAAGLALAAPAVVLLAPQSSRAVDRMSVAAIHMLQTKGALKKDVSFYERRIPEYLAGVRGTARRRWLVPGLLIAAGGFALLSRRPRPLLFAAAAVGELAAFGVGFAPAVRWSDVPGRPPIVDEIRAFDPDGTFRIAGVGPILPPNLSAHFRIADVRLYEPLVTRAFLDRLEALGFGGFQNTFVRPFGPESRRGFAALGCRWLLSRQPLEGLARVGGEPPPGVGLYEIPEAARPFTAPDVPPPGFGAGILVSVAGLALGLALTATAPASTRETASPPPPAAG